MLEATVAKKYATALFLVAKREGIAEAVNDEMQVVAAVVTHERRFVDFLTAPQVRDQDKLSMVRGALGDKVSPLVLHFLLFVVQRRRIVYLDRMAEHYRKLYDDDCGVIEATVTAAQAMPEDELTRLVGKLEKLTGKTVRTVTKVEPRIIAGVVVRLGHEIIDGSVRTKLTRLLERLLQLKVH